MDHKKHYNNLISSRLNLIRCKSKSTYHIHHIIPKSMGGSNDESNLILLTPKEHFTAHHLLAHMFPEKMSFAFNRMAYGTNITPTSRQYQSAAEMISKQMMANNPMHNPETIHKMKDTIQSRSKSLQKQISDNCRKRSLGRHLSETAKKKLSDFWSGIQRPKTDSHIQNHKDSLQKKWYITPNGTFRSLKDAAASHDVSLQTIHKRCYINCDKIIKNSRSLESKNWIGKTWKEIGFYTIPV